MSLSLSTARLPIQRWMVESGAQIDCWSGPDVTTVPPVTLSWIQRGAVMVDFLPAPTVCVSQSDSVPPRLTYWACCFTPCPVVQRSSPSLAGTLAGGSPQSAVETSAGPVSVVFAGVLQSTWNFQTRTSRLGEPPPKTARRSGRPAGG